MNFAAIVSHEPPSGLIPIQGLIAFHNGAFPARAEGFDGRPRELWIEGYVEAAVLQFRRNSAIPPQFHGKHRPRAGAKWSAAEWTFLRRAWPTEIPTTWIAHLLGCRPSRVRQAAHTLQLKRPTGAATKRARLMAAR